MPIVPVIDQASKLFRHDAENAFIDIENQIKKMFPPEVLDLTIEETNEERYGFSEDDDFVTT